MSNTKKAGRRERLLARKRPTAVHQLRVEDDSAALEELAEAKAALEVAQFRTDDGAEQALAEAQRRVAKAHKAVAACYEPVAFTALLPKDFEELAAQPEHKAREGKDEAWNSDTFPRACFLACVDTGDLTAEEWAEFAETNVSRAERTSLFLTAVGVNARYSDGTIPKG